MSKQEFSDQQQEKNETNRGGQSHGSFGGKNVDQRVGSELRKQGAHSNTGTGDEKTPLTENEKE